MGAFVVRFEHFSDSAGFCKVSTRVLRSSSSSLPTELRKCGSESRCIFDSLEYQGGPKTTCSQCLPHFYISSTVSIRIILHRLNSFSEFECRLSRRMDFSPV